MITETANDELYQTKRKLKTDEFAVYQKQAEQQKEEVENDL